MFNGKNMNHQIGTCLSSSHPVHQNFLHWHPFSTLSPSRNDKSAFPPTRAPGFVNPVPLVFSRDSLWQFPFPAHDINPSFVLTIPISLKTLKRKETKLLLAPYCTSSPLLQLPLQYNLPKLFLSSGCLFLLPFDALTECISVINVTHHVTISISLFGFVLARLLVTLDMAKLA